jgi:YbbR domain-containing protein
VKAPGLREVIALTLAVILWFFVRVTRSGTTSSQTQMQMTVPIEIKGVSSHLTVYEVSHNQVVVTVQGNTQEVSSLRETQVNALVDLTGEEAHSVYPKVSVIVPGQVKLISVQPETINVKQAPETLKQVPLKVTVSGPVARGRSAGKAAVDPKEVRITGPEPLVHEVTEARARIYLSGQSQSTTFELRDLIPVNSEGQPVEARRARLKITPTVLYATVPIEAESRSVAVAVSLENVRVEGKEGWRSTMEVEPGFITLSLTKDQQAPDYVITRPEVFSPSTRVESREVPLEIPDGFEVIGNRSVKIRVIPTRLPQASPTATPMPTPTALPPPRPSPVSPKPAPTP